MARRALSTILVAWLLALSCVLCAEQAEQPLTNADVGGMLKAGLPESTITLAIELAARRGSTDFDTTPGALIELKKAGATATILDAMLGAQLAPKRDVPSTAVPGLGGSRT